MGVMSCDRAGCKSIMCDRYNHKFGYICSDCFQQAVYLRLTRAQEIANFMASSSVVTQIDESTAREILDKLFPDRWDEN
jgi:hypothetical protein